MTLFKLKLVCIGLLLLTAGCKKEKDDLTLPVTVQFKMSFKIGFSMNSPLNHGYLHITGCHVGIGKVVFKGIREAGENYYFQTNENLDFPTFLEPITISIFDMPQGIYTDMMWAMQLWAIPNEVLLDLVEGLTIEELLAAGVVENCGDGWWNGPAIAITGTYESLNGSVIPFLLAGDFILDSEATDQLLTVRSFDPEGNSIIFLSADKEYESTMLFTLGCDSCSLNRELFEEAEISDDSGHPVIIISGSNNKDLYKNLTYRNKQAVKVIIKETGSATI